MPAERACGISHVLHQRVEPRRASCIAALFFGVLDTAEDDPRAPPGIVGRQPRTHVFLRFVLDVEAQLVV